MGVGAPLGYSADQVVARALPVFDDYAAAAAQVVEVGGGAAQLGAVRLEAGRLHSERFLEAVLEVVAPAQGYHSLRNKGLCCRRGLCIQTPRVPTCISFKVYQFSRIIQRREVTFRWRKRAIYGNSNFAYAAECVLAPMAAFPLVSPYSLLVKLLPPPCLLPVLSQNEILRKDRANIRGN